MLGSTSLWPHCFTHIWGAGMQASTNSDVQVHIARIWLLDCILEQCKEMRKKTPAYHLLNWNGLFSVETTEINANHTIEGTL